MIFQVQSLELCPEQVCRGVDIKVCTEEAEGQSFLAGQAMLDDVQHHGRQRSHDQTRMNRRSKLKGTENVVGHFRRLAPENVLEVQRQDGQ